MENYLSKISDRKPLDWTVPTVALGHHQVATVFYRHPSGLMSPYSLGDAVKQEFVRVKELGASWQNAVALIEIRMSRVCIVLRDEAAEVEEPAISRKEYESMKRKERQQIENEYGLQQPDHFNRKPNQN